MVFGPWFGFVLLGSMNTSPHAFLVCHTWSWFLFFFLVVTFSGCASSTSEENTKTTDVVLCWLRPSCLPSKLSSDHKQTPQTPVARTPVPRSKPVATLSQATPNPGYRSNPRPSHSPPKSTCQAPATLALSAARTSILVSYKEPTKRADGRPLTDLVKTTIYFDVGKGWMKAKDIPSSGPEGGGTISETVPLPSGKRTSPTIRVCVTATDSRGLEG